LESTACLGNEWVGTEREEGPGAEGKAGGALARKRGSARAEPEGKSAPFVEGPVEVGAAPKCILSGEVCTGSAVLVSGVRRRKGGSLNMVEREERRGSSIPVANGVTPGGTSRLLWESAFRKGQGRKAFLSRNQQGNSWGAKGVALEFQRRAHGGWASNI